MLDLRIEFSEGFCAVGVVHGEYIITWALIRKVTMWYFVSSKIWVSSYQMIPDLQHNELKFNPVIRKSSNVYKSIKLKTL